MKCPICGKDNKDSTKVCKKCGSELVEIQMWKPDWRWHLKVLGIIYSSLIIIYFAVSAFLTRVEPPYRMRDIPEEMTPWLKK